MPHMSFLLKQLLDRSDIYTLQITREMKCIDGNMIEIAGGKSDGTDVSVMNNEKSKHFAEYYSRQNTECPLVVMYPKQSYVECEGSMFQMTQPKIRVEVNPLITHPGYCQIKYFNGQVDMSRAGHKLSCPINSAVAHRGFEGFRCFIWPSCAAEWIRRKTKTKWPSTELKKKIEAEGCFVIWRPHPKSKYPEFEWQFLFSNAEKVLFRDGLSKHQRYLYDVLKIAIDYQTKTLDVKLHTVHAKSVFFYACESIQESMFEDSAGGCFLYMIGSLLESLRKRNLPNYFVRENNMIDHLEEEDLTKLADAIETLRVYPLQSITFLMVAKGYNRAWLVDIVSEDSTSFKSNADMNRLIRQLFFPTMIRHARKLANRESFKDAYDKVSKARQLLVMASDGKDGNSPEVPNLDQLLRDTLEPANEYTKGMMAQLIEEMTDMKLYTADTALKNIKDYTGGEDVAGYGNRKMPIELLGNPLLESIFLNDLGADQQNQFHNDENASKMYEAAIDHLENEIDNIDNNRDENNSLPTDIRRKCKAYKDMLALFYNNLIKAY